jgi:hypothetical protein
MLEREYLTKASTYAIMQLHYAIYFSKKCQNKSKKIPLKTSGIKCKHGMFA